MMKLLKPRLALKSATVERQAFYQLREHNRRRRQQGYANYTW